MINLFFSERENLISYFSFIMFNSLIGIMMLFSLVLSSSYIFVVLFLFKFGLFPFISIIFNYISFISLFFLINYLFLKFSYFMIYLIICNNILCLFGFFYRELIALVVLMSLVILFVLSVSVNIVSFNLYTLVSSTFNYLILLILETMTYNSIFSFLYIFFYTLISFVLYYILFLIMSNSSSHYWGHSLIQQSSPHTHRSFNSTYSSLPTAPIHTSTSFNYLRDPTYSPPPIGPQPQFFQHHSSPLHHQLSSASFSTGYSYVSPHSHSSLTSIPHQPLPSTYSSHPSSLSHMLTHPSTSFNFIDIISISPFTYVLYTSLFLYLLIVSGIIPLFVYYIKLFFITFVSSTLSISFVFFLSFFIFFLFSFTFLNLLLNLI